MAGIGVMRTFRKLKVFFSNNENILLALTMSSVVLGLMAGFLIKYNFSLTDRQTYLLSFPGEILMNMLKMLIVPLLSSSLITGLSVLDSKSSGKMGFYTIIYYCITTIISIVMGIILVTSIHPGNPNIKKSSFIDDSITGTNSGPLDAILDLIRNIFLPNIVEACFRQVSTDHVSEKVLYYDNKTEKYENKTKFVLNQIESTNVLGLVSVSIAFGLILGQMGNQAKVMFQFFKVMNEVIMKIVKLIMWYFPFGIFFLIMSKILEIKDVAVAASSLGLYIVTVLLGLFIHGLIILPLMFAVVTRKNPFRFFAVLIQAWLAAFGTASSTATLPITFRCLEDNNLVSKRFTRFVLPIGATINMDGTALYEAVASIFIAQINGMVLSFGQTISLSITATLAAIGASCVPSSGLVTMIPALASVGLPLSDITLILTVDWFLDRVRTTINVLGDSLGSGIIEHLCHKTQNEANICEQKPKTYIVH